MKDLIEKLKKEVILASENPEFIHHKWFVKYHGKTMNLIHRWHNQKRN